jgi:hypothetical protein
MKTNHSKTNSSSDPKGEVSNLKESLKKLKDKIFHLHSHEIALDGRATDFFFVKIGFCPIKSLNSSRKSIKKFGNHEISTSYKVN